MCTKIFGKTKNRFDNGDYSQINQFYDKTNKKVNKFKDELRAILCKNQTKLEMKNLDPLLKLTWK